METLVSISEMAKLHGLTRQTLIYYDEIDLFKPLQVDGNGYRFYSKKQIPYLREICFLKSLGISLKDIVVHFQGRCPQKEMILLQKQKENVLHEIARLNKIRESINQRLNIYEEAEDARMMQMQEPFIRSMPARKMLLKEYIQPIDKENLHTTLMGLWKEIVQKEIVPSGGFGSVIKKESVLAGNPLLGAGSCSFISQWNNENSQATDLPAGLYACMYKYGMPYDMTHVKKLMGWLERNGYELVGDIVDMCLLDTTFYRSDQDFDFCMLQAPIKFAKKSEDIA